MDNIYIPIYLIDAAKKGYIYKLHYAICSRRNIVKEADAQSFLDDYLVKVNDTIEFFKIKGD